MATLIITCIAMTISILCVFFRNYDKYYKKIFCYIVIGCSFIFGELFYLIADKYSTVVRDKLYCYVGKWMRAEVFSNMDPIYMIVVLWLSIIISAFVYKVIMKLIFWILKSDEQDVSLEEKRIMYNAVVVNIVLLSWLQNSKLEEIVYYTVLAISILVGFYVSLDDLLLEKRKRDKKSRNRTKNVVLFSCALGACYVGDKISISIVETGDNTIWQTFLLFTGELVVFVILLYLIKKSVLFFIKRTKNIHTVNNMKNKDSKEWESSEFSVEVFDKETNMKKEYHIRIGTWNGR